MRAVHEQKEVSPVKHLVEMTGKQRLLVFLQYYVGCCCIGDVNAFFFPASFPWKMTFIMMEISNLPPLF